MATNDELKAIINDAEAQFHRMVDIVKDQLARAEKAEVRISELEAALFQQAVRHSGLEGDESS